MTLRGRLAVAFTTILLAPIALGAAALAGLTTGVPAGGGGEDRTAEDARAADAVRAVVQARCAHLAVTASGLATTAGAAGLSWAVLPSGATGPWAICGVHPALQPDTLPTGLAARAEIQGAGGVSTGTAYAVQPLDDAFLAELSAAAGRRVSLTAGNPSPYGLDVTPDTAGPLRLSLDPVPAPANRDPLPVLLVAVGVALLAASLLGAWLGDVATRPLRRLVAAVDRASAGDLSARTAVDGRDETGRLGQRLDELIAGLQETQRLSVTDALTGLGNRRALGEELRIEIERASRFGRALGVLALDLDHFKEINDRYGHRAGDGVLVELAVRIRRVVREVDLAFRQGGEEFVILLPETDVAGSLTAARRVCDAVRGVPFPNGVAVTVSVGVAVFPRHACTSEDLLEAADNALYAAKAAGRDTFVLADPSHPRLRPPDADPSHPRLRPPDADPSHPRLRPPDAGHQSPAPALTTSVPAAPATR